MFAQSRCVIRRVGAMYVTVIGLGSAWIDRNVATLSMRIKILRAAKLQLRLAGVSSKTKDKTILDASSERGSVAFLF